MALSTCWATQTCKTQPLKNNELSKWFYIFWAGWSFIQFPLSPVLPLQQHVPALSVLSAPLEFALTMENVWPRRTGPALRRFPRGPPEVGARKSQPTHHTQGGATLPRICTCKKADMLACNHADLKGKAQNKHEFGFYYALSNDSC